MKRLFIATLFLCFSVGFSLARPHPGRANGCPRYLLGWHYMYYYRNAYALNQYLANHGYIVLSVNYRSGIGYGLEFREALNYGATGGSEFNKFSCAGRAWVI